MNTRQHLESYLGWKMVGDDNTLSDEDRETIEGR